MFFKKLKIRHKMFLGFALVIAIMLAVISYSYFSFLQSERALDSNIETFEFISNTDNILESMINMETAARGYALVGKEEYLEPYHLGKLEFEKYYDLAKQSSLDKPRQQESLLEIKEAHDSWLEWGNKSFIQARQELEAGLLSQEDLNAIYQKGDGKIYMDSIRLNIDKIIQEEDAILKERTRELDRLKSRTLGLMSIGGLVATILGSFTAIFITENVVGPVNSLRDTFSKISEGAGDYRFRLDIESEDELGRMAESFNLFMDKIELIIIENTNANWIKTGQNEVNDILKSIHSIEELGEEGIKHISKYIHGQVASIYLNKGNDDYQLLGSYGLEAEDYSQISPGGLLFQASLDKESILVEDIPGDYLHISSGLGQASPENLLISPCIYDDQVELVLEIGKFDKFTDQDLIFIEAVSSSLAASAQSILAKDRMEELLEKTLEQSEELQVQQEELRQTNEELEEQAKALTLSEEELQIQKEELKVANEELEEQSKALLIERNNVIKKNENLRIAKKEIEEKARDIQITSKYKSEFLANMSHELRTPLNSILVLSQILADKEEGTKVKEKYLEYASTIHSSGQDLLRLINDVLDLSKVEAGKMEVNLEEINLESLAEYVRRSFNHIGEKKGIELITEVDKDLPDRIISDQLRLEQILKNLLSNAFKFTEEGQVVFSISKAKKKDFISISIEDTGIGIPADKQADIFDAFKQSDGTTSRKYGGTGLGLSISKELASLLKADIHMESEEGRGSLFSLIIPMNYEAFEEIEEREPNIKNKSNKTQDKDLPDIDTYVSEDFKNILVLVDKIEDNQEIFQALAREDREITGLESANQALDIIREENFDCIILDLNLKDMSGIDLLKKLSQDYLLDLPVIIYTDDMLTEDEEIELLGYAESIIIKGLRSSERLVAETDLFLESLDKKIEEEKISSQKSIKSIQEKEDALRGRKILIIDDDMRNVFALSSLLEEKGLKIVVGRNGEEGLDKLKTEEGIDLILMDIMMPIMDGYEAMNKIRNEIGLKDIPIIALTAKAMKDDREKAIESGANDYLTKPVDVDKLISLLRVWLYK